MIHGPADLAPKLRDGLMPNDRWVPFPGAGDAHDEIRDMLSQWSTPNASSDSEITARGVECLRNLNEIVIIEI